MLGLDGFAYQIELDWHLAVIVSGKSPVSAPSSRLIPPPPILTGVVSPERAAMTACLASIEGAIKHIIGRRLDHGGMRWIKERAEALLQLRCIAINGDWTAFERYVHDCMHAEALVDHARVRLQSPEPAPLPKLAEAA